MTASDSADDDFADAICSSGTSRIVELCLFFVILDLIACRFGLDFYELSLDPWL